LNYKNLIDNIHYLFDHRKSCKVHIKIFDESFENAGDEQLFYDTFSNICDTISVEYVVDAFPAMEYDANITKRRQKLNKNMYWERAKKKKICPFPFFQMVINPSGNIITCLPDWKENFVVGSILKDSLYNIWNGSKLYTLRCQHITDGWASLPYCKDCTCVEYFSLDNIDPYEDIILTKVQDGYLRSERKI
jgi:radical SAM protein with 4Fe4S-binding SPASM domain